MISFSTFSQTFTWDGDSDGDGDGLKWGDPLNWVQDQLPGKGSIVEIGSDSVLLSFGVEIKQLILESGGILLFEDSSGDFIIENSPGEGIIINGGAKLYIDGSTIITNAANNGIDLQANSDLVIREDHGVLQILGTNSDGILGGIGATFTNRGQIYMDGIGSEGLDLRHFVNHGYIEIDGANTLSAKLAGSVGYNNGDFICNDGLTAQLSSTFLNDTSAVLSTEGVLTVACDFVNDGRVDIRNKTGTSFAISTGVTFTNTKELFARTSTATTFSIANGGVLENLKGAKFRVTPNSTVAAGQYFFDMDGASTKLINKGLIDINLGQKMEGFFLENRSVIENYGEFYLDNYFDEGFFIDPLGVNTEVIKNIDTAYFAVGAGLNSDAVAFEFNTRVRVRNDTCATMIFRDSVAIQGSLGMRLDNFGLLELEAFSKKSNAVFENEGAVYIADTSLAFTPIQV